MAVTEGMFQLVFKDASGMRRDVVYGPVRTEELDRSTDIRQRLFVPFLNNKWVEEDDKIDMEIKGDTAGTMDSGSGFFIPVTIVNKKTNVARETYLTVSDFGLTATDVDYTTSYTVVATYTVSAQEAVFLGHKTLPNSRIYVTLVVS